MTELKDLATATDYRELLATNTGGYRWRQRKYAFAKRPCHIKAPSASFTFPIFEHYETIDAALADAYRSISELCIQKWRLEPIGPESLTFSIRTRDQISARAQEEIDSLYGHDRLEVPDWDAVLDISVRVKAYVAPKSTTYRKGQKDA